MKRTQRDNNQIQQFEHDEKANAKRVKMVGTEMSIELDHKDGDSVTTHPAKLSASALGVDAEDNDKMVIPALDCSSIRTMKVIVVGEGNVKVMLSPTDDGDHFYEASVDDLNNLCARRIKVISIDLIGDVHIVGRS